MTGSTEHIVPRKVYVLVAGALLLLLLLTYALAEVNLGDFNIVVALTIATVKMLLVVLFFMELRWSAHLTWIVAGASLFWLALLVLLTLSDFLTRLPVHLPGA
jgi:cytochrome c oxidase subunit 4